MSDQRSKAASEPLSASPLANEPATAAWLTVLAAAAAGGMGWGIRGQYGHETGAMIAGVLVSLVLVVRLAPTAALLPAARAAALGTIAMGFGGSMTYGQTIGLTQNSPVIGNVSALAWGMLGLAVKGGLWIGFAGLFLGLGLGRRRFGWLEMAAIAVAGVGLFFLGVWLINTPYDPASRQLPSVSFSADWRWEPDNAGLKPRPEVWGGMLLALLGSWAWVGLVRGERLACWLTLWGVLGGALGFPLGQCLQAGHAWNREWFATSPFAALDGVMNWWNWMETSFGTVMGAALAIGLVRNRQLIGLPRAGSPRPAPAATIDLPLPAVLLLLATHVVLLVLCEMVELPPFTQAYDHGLIAGMLPLVAVAGGQASPFLMMLPITLLPISAKTISMLVLNDALLSPAVGWSVYGVLPMVLATGLAVWLARRGRTPRASGRLLAIALLLTTLAYYLLNLAVFHFPWPWLAWTGRTPNAIAFTVAGVVVLAAAGLALAPRPAAPLLDSRDHAGQD